jgi:hypothetical protein
LWFRIGEGKFEYSMIVLGSISWAIGLPGQRNVSGTTYFPRTSR